MLDAQIIDELHLCLPFMQNADTAIDRELVSHCTVARIAAGRFVLLEGAPCSGLGLILDGVARVYKSGETGREITLYRIEPGESCVLTASCIMSGDAFPAHARVEEDLRAIVVPADVLRRWVRQYEFWQQYLFDLLSKRLASVIAVLEEVTFHRMDRRLADFLCADAGDGASPLAVTHHQIASDLGTSREVVSRLLKDFERRGMVALSRNVIEIVDAEGLRDIASAN